MYFSYIANRCLLAVLALFNYNAFKGKSMVTIQSQTLENLLEALDARHLAGWYHPAMRLQGRVNYLQGSNAELRAQLQQIR
jgi:centrosomal protein CEP290